MLAYSVDDSWASLAVMGDSFGMLVMVALAQGVPMRGAMSVGKVVINAAEESIFVGAPISDAYVSDKSHLYRGVGVHVTPSAVSQLAAKAKAERPDIHLIHAFSPALFHAAQAPQGEKSSGSKTRCSSTTGEAPTTWRATATSKGARRQSLCSRSGGGGALGLAEDDSTQVKLEQSRQFLRDRFRHRSKAMNLPPAITFGGKQKDYERLDAIGLRDVDAVRSSSGLSLSRSRRPIDTCKRHLDFRSETED